ncbi:2-amino-4-hydroxy-6-hydroxymethyldihydropteridine diphosphokinase [Oceanispirochaeta crateris]|uniref:2-amino-4-hydroxy-6-hydroxymethyldihydropteridine pyrophosphokinase n=1 Tax=Oceanispirochaeta crateris TaxID=2518645 RepID=A0A5C1QLF2_9SPIO|nr:2-amino-4-hydroxy-6-hydroxymethyldihydropteridine diphosphokinase [Oceanispirochaeta crateris]QEN07790.1 2-amino-4-hydroxy-6-hydroxymethyldihydropteridine diphosphokinase [Oceanispirochaeta crateris]
MNSYLGVGSNLDPKKNIKLALKELINQGFSIQKVSTHYRTEPLKHKENPSYINGIWCLNEYSGSRSSLKDILKNIETKCGRIRTDDPYSSRTLDLDIILHRDYISPDILTREFIFVPLLEIAPNLKLPGLGKLNACAAPSDRQRMQPLSDFTNELRRMIHE